MDDLKARSPFFFARLSLLACFGLCFSGCVETTAPPPSPHRLEKKVSPVPDWVLKIRQDEKEGNFPQALAELEKTRNVRERNLWESRILKRWSLFDIDRAKSLERSGHADDASFLLEAVFKRSPEFLTNPPSSLTPSLFRKFLEREIEENQELLAIKQLTMNDLLDKEEKKGVLFDAYIHLTKRRMSEEKFHYAMLDLKKAFVLKPVDPEALSLQTLLSLQAKKWTEKGYQAFADQNLHKAIYYWKRAQEIRPEDKSLPENIHKAQNLLEKLQKIEKEQVKDSPGGQNTGK